MEAKWEAANGQCEGDDVDPKTTESANKVTQFLNEFQRADNSNDIGKLYDQWTDYDKDLKGVHFRSPIVTADIIAEYIPSDMRSEAAVMDIGCGTGFLGEELQKRGFCVIDGIDPSAKSLDLARQKNVYRSLICDYVTDKRLDIDNDTYDVVGASGTLVPGHLPALALHEMLRISKPGAVICLTARKEYWDTVPEYNLIMKLLIQQLHDDGLLKIVSIESITKYYYMHAWKDGIVIILRKI